jgi:hypothetical protein
MIAQASWAYGVQAYMCHFSLLHSTGFWPYGVENLCGSFCHRVTCILQLANNLIGEAWETCCGLSQVFLCRRNHAQI